MLNFDAYVMRHGEFWVQALIEQIEQVSGVRADRDAPLPLEARWNALVNAPHMQMAA